MINTQKEEVSMKAIMVMYDSLRRDLLSCYGGPIPTPNFKRLEERAVCFENCYAGSLPCMPARRELQTGRYNFLHRYWGPMEPFDDSMPELLKQHGIHTRLTTDHYHYLEDGGCTYHSRYSDWACYRGQAFDPWISDLAPQTTEFPANQLNPMGMPLPQAKQRSVGCFQNMINRTTLKSNADYPMEQTFQDAIDFLDKNGTCDNWFLQIETFDPHEPFTSPESFQAGFLSPDGYDTPDWPSYAKVAEDTKTVNNVRGKYNALTAFCDAELGRILDKMDEMNLWEDTMLIVNTDHGFFLSEHDWWGKGFAPNYDELVHIPMLIWDPRTKVMGERRQSLVQTIDLAPTLLDYFGVDIPKDMEGHALKSTIVNDEPVREYGMFGYHNSPVGITDGRYVLLRAVQDMNVTGYEYTMMPTNMRNMFPIEQLKTMKWHPGFEFTKGAPVMQIESRMHPRFMNAQKEKEDLLFDLVMDPKQERPIQDDGIKSRMLHELKKLFELNDAPKEAYDRYGLQD